MSQAVESAEYRLGYDIFTGIDAAGSNFYENKKYILKDKSVSLSAADLADFYKELIEKYHILYLEDALAEDDWEGWQTAYTNISKDIILTGDDLTVTNPIRLQMALEKKTISGIIIKPNQIGTVSESIAVVEMARGAGIKVITSHRSGETNDDFIADFAVGVTADYVKFGAPARGERIAKYNRLSQIDRQLKTQ
jgi:enolase